MSSSSTSSLTRSIFHTHLCHTHTTTYIHTYSHTYVPSYIHTYIHTYIPTYIHTYIPTVLPSRSFTTSFVFPFFPVPAKTIEAHFRKKLTCGVIRSFNFSTGGDVGTCLGQRRQTWPWWETSGVKLGEQTSNGLYPEGRSSPEKREWTFRPGPYLENRGWAFR